MRVSSARLISAAVKNMRAMINSNATPYSCRMLKYALANATITSNDVMMALIVEKKDCFVKQRSATFEAGNIGF